MNFLLFPWSLLFSHPKRVFYISIGLVIWAVLLLHCFSFPHRWPLTFLLVISLVFFVRVFNLDTRQIWHWVISTILVLNFWHHNSVINFHYHFIRLVFKVDKFLVEIVKLIANLRPSACFHWYHIFFDFSATVFPFSNVHVGLRSYHLIILHHFNGVDLLKMRVDL
jgi:hypothetical protein